ncbi:DUF945 family protein [Aliidiomarina sp. Khilg15.8]
MKRVLKWLVPILIILGLAYLVVVWVTGEKTRELTSERINTYQQQNPGLNVNVEWQREGFWSSEATFTVAAAELADMFYMEHEVVLKHGFFRSAVDGTVDVFWDGNNLTDNMFSQEPVVVDGHVGLAGLALVYHLPDLSYASDASSLLFSMPATRASLVLTDDEQHSEMSISSLSLIPQDPESDEEGVFLNDLMMTSQVRLDRGEPVFAVTEINLAEMTMAVANESPRVVSGFTSAFTFEREAADFVLDSQIAVDNFSYGSVKGRGHTEFEMRQLPYAAFKRYQESEQDEADMEQWLAALQANNAELVIDTIDLEMENWGKLEGSGAFTMNAGASTDLGSGFNAMNFANGYLEMTELPEMLRLALAELTEDELPWRFELRAGDLFLNGKPLNLPAQ